MLSDILSEYIAENKYFHFDGDKGVESLENIVKDIGYPGHGFRFGSPVEHFLSDNPGAIEALINWIGEQDLQEWSDNLESTLPERDGEAEHD